MARPKKVTVYASGERLYYRWTDEDGQRRNAPVGLTDSPTSRALAERIGQRMTNDLRSGQFDHSLQRYAVPKRKSAGPDLLTVWNAFHEMKEKRLAPSTLRTYRRVRRIISELPFQNLADAPEMYGHIIEHQTNTNARQAITHIRAACKWARMTGRVKEDPWERLKPPKAEGEPEPFPFTLEERDLILETLGDSIYRPYIEFLFRVGCRPGEASALWWENIQPAGGGAVVFAATICRAKGGAIRRPHLKTQRRRRVPLDSKTKALLDSVKPDQVEASQPVFVGPQGRAINSDFIGRDIWRPLLEKLGLEHRPLYQCRSTAITMMLKKGLPVHEVTKLVGNSPNVIYRHYAGIALDLRLPEL